MSAPAVPHRSGVQPAAFGRAYGQRTPAAAGLGDRLRAARSAEVAV